MGKISNKGEKNEIYYSRDYRHLNRAWITYLLQIIFVLVPVILIYLCSYSEISYYISEFSAGLINNITGDTTGILKEKYFPIFGGIYYITMKGRYPSFTMAMISFIVTLILIVVFARINMNRKPLMIFLTIGLCVHLASSLFFIFFGDKFPYTLDTYSILYMKQQIIVWLMIIVVYWLSTSLITHVTWYRIISLAMLMVLSFVYGIVRYILYMIIISQFSYLFMASLYFTFGVLFDFLIMVGIFSLFIYMSGKKFQGKKRGRVWKWS